MSRSPSDVLEALQQVLLYADFNSEESHADFLAAVEEARAVAQRAENRTAQPPSASLLDHIRANKELADNNLELRGVLQEIRTRLHVAGRRPEECYEMSMIDDALRAPETKPARTDDPPREALELKHPFERAHETTASKSCNEGGTKHCPYFSKRHPCCDCGATVSETGTTA